MRYYEIVLSEQELAELAAGYASIYCASRDEQNLADLAYVNFLQGSKEAQKSIADKLNLLLGNPDAEETL